MSTAFGRCEGPQSPKIHAQWSQYPPPHRMVWVGGTAMGSPMVLWSLRRQIHLSRHLIVLRRSKWKLRRVFLSLDSYPTENVSSDTACITEHSVGVTTVKIHCQKSLSLDSYPSYKISAETVCFTEQSSGVATVKHIVT